VAETPVASWRVQVYARAGALGGQPVTYANGLWLAGWAVDAAGVPPGGVVVVHLGWEDAAAQRSGSEKVSLQLLNAAGRLVAQQDVPLGRTLTPDLPASYGILVPTAGAGDGLTLAVVVYDPGAAGAPRLLTTDGLDAVMLARLNMAAPGVGSDGREFDAGAP
jgi:hypothetical protein